MPSPGTVVRVVADSVAVWYNPRCSKYRGAEELLAAYGVSANRLLYLDTPPSRAEIVRVLGLIGASDPRALMRTAEPRAELGLDARHDELVDAMSRYPELIERPVVIWADRAIIARPRSCFCPCSRPPGIEPVRSRRSPIRQGAAGGSGGTAGHWMHT
jgi:arsenate reductase (glutaredoxin)